MAKRNIEKTAEQGLKIITANTKRDLMTKEVETMRDTFIKNGGGCVTALFKTIETAFYMGVAIGHRTARAERGRRV